MAPKKPTLHEKIDKLLGYMEGDGEDHVTLAVLGERMSQMMEMKDMVADHERRLGVVEGRVTLWHGGQALLTLIASSIAGWFGTRH